MGRTVSLFLMRAAGMLLAGMLLFAVFAPAHAQTDASYGLKRFPGDNYDSLPPGAGIPAPPAPQGYAPVSGSGVSASGYYGMLNGGTSVPAGAPAGSPAPQPADQQAPYQQAQPQQAQSYPAQAQSYQPVPGYAQPAPAWQPQSSYQPQSAYQA